MATISAQVSLLDRLSVPAAGGSRHLLLHHHQRRRLLRHPHDHRRHTGAHHHLRLGLCSLSYTSAFKLICLSHSLTLHVQTKCGISQDDCWHKLAQLFGTSAFVAATRYSSCQWPYHSGIYNRTNVTCGALSIQWMVVVEGNQDDPKNYTSERWV